MSLKTIYHKAPTSQNALSFWISLQVCVGAGIFVSIGAQSKRFDVDEKKMDVSRKWGISPTVREGSPVTDLGAMSPPLRSG